MIYIATLKASEKGPKGWRRKGETSIFEAPSLKAARLEYPPELYDVALSDASGIADDARVYGGEIVSGPCCDDEIVEIARREYPAIMQAIEILIKKEKTNGS